MKTKMLRALLVLLLLVPFASFPVPAQAAVIGGQLYGTGGDITVEILPADAGFTSALYLYSPVFRLIGTNREVGKVVTLTGIAAGEELVFGIQVHDTGDIFKMGPGSRNIDGRAHAAVTQIAERAFDVGFEDMAFTGDWDYNDNMFRFTGALAPVPPPVDNVPPVTVHGPLPAANGYGWLNQPVTISFTATDTAQPGAAVSGVERIYPTLDGAAQGCPTGDSCSLSVAASGMHTVSYHARDNAGNTEAAQQLALQIDLDAPQLNGGPVTMANANGWYDAPVVIAFGCSDALSGVAACPGQMTLQAEGAGVGATATASDLAGNIASVVVTGINIDMTAPTMAYTSSGTGGWNNGPVSVHFTCTDGLSGIDTCPGDVTLTESAESATVTATDLAGNSTDITVAAQIDQSAPAIAGAPDRAPNAAGWYNAPVTVTFTCSDGYSGIAACTGPATLAEGAGQSVTGTAADMAGNTASATVDGINIDMTAPLIAGAPDRAANANGWYNADVTVSFVCSDDLSGIASCTAPAILGEGAGQSLSGTAVDVAGNAAGATVSDVNIDKTAPVVAYSGNAGSYAVDQMIAITCAASDALSGLESSDCADISGPAYALELGSHSYSASATDLAGNTTEATVSFIVGISEDSLCRLVQQWSSKEGIAISLCAKLRNIAKANTPQARAGLIGAFIHEVEAQSGKAITEERAAILVSLAGKL